MTSNASADDAPDAATADRLDSWKEIASYLGRTVRTVQTWEKEEGLPVHRHHHGKRGTVYAYQQELDAWLAERSAAPEAKHHPRGGLPRLWSAVLAGVVVAILAVLGWRTWDVGSDRDALDETGSLQFGERDWILVADLVNRSGDELLDGTLEAALERELGTSRHVNVVPRPRIEDALRLMRRPLDDQLDRATAREICLRDGEIRAFVAGRVERLGGIFVLSVEVVEPETGTTVSSFSVEVAEEKDLLPAVRGLSSRIRETLGETPATIRESEQRLAKVTTPSLRALHLYTQADRLVGGANDAAAEELLRQAVVEDPQFASAWMLLAFALRNQDPAFEAFFSGASDTYHPEESYVAAAERALELASNSTESERYFIRGGYFSMVGDFDKSITAYEALVRIDPDHLWGQGNLANWLRRAGRHEEALSHEIKLAALRPRHYGIQCAASQSLVELGRLEEAAVLADRARALLTEEETARRPGRAAWVRLFPVHLHWQATDAAAAEQELEHIATDLILEPEASRRALAQALFYGYLSIGQAQKALAVYEAHGYKPNRRLTRGWVAFMNGDLERLKAELSTPALPGTPRFPLPERARTLLLVQAGLVDDAEAALTRFEKAFPDDASLPVLRAQVASARSDPVAAARRLESVYASARELGGLPLFSTAWMLADLRARGGDLAGAAEVLEDASERRRRTYMGLEPFWMAVRLRLWRAYQLLGREEDAATVQAELLRLTARADPEDWVLCTLGRPAEGCGAARGLRHWPAPQAARRAAGRVENPDPTVASARGVPAGGSAVTR